jgi:hypothetical protein
MCFVRISEQTAIFASQNITRLVFITEAESVYSAVRTESLYKTDTLRLLRVNEKQSVNELRVICTIVGQWEKLNHQPYGFTLLYRLSNERLKQCSKSRTSQFTNFQTVLYVKYRAVKSVAILLVTAATTKRLSATEI